MDNFAQKVKLIFIPWLLITIATAAVCTFLHWYLFISNNLFKLDEEALNLWLPAVIPWIPILIWLRPRLKLLELKNPSGRGNPLVGYMMIAWFTMIAPNVIAQSYVFTATGKLTSLRIINDIGKSSLTKYYKLGRFYFDKNLAHSKAVFKVSGKHNQDFDMYYYLVCPILDHDHDHTVSDSVATAKSPVVTAGTASVPPPAYNVNQDIKPMAWLGVRYERTVSNHLTADEKDAAYHDFASASQKDYQTENFNDFTYLDRISYSSDQRNYIAAATDELYGPENASTIIFMPVYEPFEARNGNKLIWICASLAIGAAVFLLILLFKPLKQDAIAAD